MPALSNSENALLIGFFFLGLAALFASLAGVTLLRTRTSAAAVGDPCRSMLRMRSFTDSDGAAAVVAGSASGAGADDVATGARLRAS